MKRLLLGWIGESSAAFAFVERNFNLAKRYLGWEIVFLMYTVVNTLTIGMIGVGGPGSHGSSQVLYLVVGALLWGFLSVLFFEVSHSVAWERWEGTIEYTFMAPVRRITYLAGVCGYASVYGLVRSVLVLCAAALFFDISLAGSNVGAALIVLLVSSFSFLGLGLTAAVLPLISPEKGAQAASIIQAVLLLISGVYYDVSALPVWLQPFSRVSPATYALRAARRAIMEGAGLGQLWPEVLTLLGLGAVLIPLGHGVFAWGENYARRTGKLKRSG